MDTKILEDIGLTQNEAKIYFILCVSEGITARQISKKIDMHRSRIYEALNRLMKKGIAHFVTINNIKHYDALPPEKLLDLLDDRREQLQNIIPKLKKIQEPKEIIQRIQGYQGTSGIKTLLKETLNAKEYVVFGAPQESINALNPAYWKNYNQKIKENKIKTRMIFDEKLRTWSKEIKKINTETKIKYLEKQFDNLTETFVYENKTIIIAWSNPPLGMQITDESIAKSYKQFFEMLWIQAKD
jgi:HTH-type transcriptional regulator, sugar sensing transcriptional regulator